MAIPLNRVDNILSLVGALAMKWNEAELVWFLIYTGLVYQLPRKVAEAIFKRQTTGNAQRELILSIANVALKGHPEILSFLSDARTETNNLAVERNDIVHADYVYALENPREPHAELLELRIAPGGSRTKHRNLFAAKSLESEIPPLIDDVNRLIQQLDEARHHIIWTFLPPSHRPQPLPEGIPEQVRLGWLARDPSLEPPKTPLIWKPIRPTARRQT